jgi:histidyl-tRNA synthetase
MTPTLARLVTARHKDFKKPLKWFSIPQVFRYERQQKGRLREHFQLNCDIIGEPSLEADVELIALVIDVLRACGLTAADFVVRLSDRQFWGDFMDAHGLAEDQRYAFIQAIDKSEREEREVTAQKLGAAAGEVFAILDDPAQGRSERLDTVEVGLRWRGLHDYVKRDYTVVRGLAYYTGVVFEVFDRSGEFRAIAGGGRYDTLLKNLGGVDLPALGFGMGDVVLGEILKKKELAGKNRDTLDFYVAVADEQYRPAAMALVQKLRDHDDWTDYSLKPMKLGKQLEAATERKASFICIVGPESEQGQVQLRKSHGKQTKVVPIERVFEYLGNESWKPEPISEDQG